MRREHYEETQIRFLLPSSASGQTVAECGGQPSIPPRSLLGFTNIQILGVEQAAQGSPFQPQMRFAI